MKKLPKKWGKLELTSDSCPSAWLNLPTANWTRGCRVMKKKKKNTQAETIDRYTVQGVPKRSIPEMCKELKISEKKLMKYLSGQTCAVVGDESIIYSWDIKRFLKGLPNND